MAKTLTPFTVIARDELARPPSLLVEHGAAGVAQLSAGVVLAGTLVVATAGHRAVASMAMAGTLAADGDILDGVEVAPSNVKILGDRIVQENVLVAGDGVEFLESQSYESRLSEFKKGAGRSLSARSPVHQGYRHLAIFQWL